MCIFKRKDLGWLPLDSVINSDLNFLFVQVFTVWLFLQEACINSAVD